MSEAGNMFEQLKDWMREKLNIPGIETQLGELQQRISDAEVAQSIAEAETEELQVEYTTLWTAVEALTEAHEADMKKALDELEERFKEVTDKVARDFTSILMVSRGV